MMREWYKLAASREIEVIPKLLSVALQREVPGNGHCLGPAPPSRLRSEVIPAVLFVAVEYVSGERGVPKNGSLERLRDVGSV